MLLLRCRCMNFLDVTSVVDLLKTELEVSARNIVLFFTDLSGVGEESGTRIGPYLASPLIKDSLARGQMDMGSALRQSIRDGAR